MEDGLQLRLSKADGAQKVHTIAKNMHLHHDVLLMQKVGLPQSLFNGSDAEGRSDIMQYLLSERPLPESMTSSGIESIKPVVVLMWRPFCLRKLSKHWLSPEQHLENLHRAINLHREARSHNIKVVLVSYGDLIWNHSRAQEKLSQIPCLGNTDMGFTPSEGVDVFPGNHIKAKGSLIQFSASISQPETFSYDANTQTCTGSDVKDSQLRTEIMNAEERLKSLE
eukprot:CAMPEP_0184487116 /NCGR_PEP_ID=MMETSP0113_2-20130426/9259_1 /TAXON_ID=91329 /ORGANISM="Norrisiella sphaerica, Strain BC52" /LENGTH=223 /DNA_ID=CAMNT_0026869299 /DNA_START=457 /DNA_END=1128 /DNA_ORIENTATION=+